MIDHSKFPEKKLLEESDSYSILERFPNDCNCSIRWGDLINDW